MCNFGRSLLSHFDLKSHLIARNSHWIALTTSCHLWGQIHFFDQALSKSSMKLPVAVMILLFGQLTMLHNHNTSWMQTPLDHWNMDALNVDAPFAPLETRNSGNGTKGSCEGIMSLNHKKILENKYCFLNGSYEHLNIDDLRIYCENVKLERGPVERAIVVVPENFLQLDLFGTDRRFCADVENSYCARTGMTLAFWFSPSKCQKHGRLSVSIESKKKKCLFMSTANSTDRKEEEKISVIDDLRGIISNINGSVDLRTLSTKEQKHQMIVDVLQHVSAVTQMAAALVLERPQNESDPLDIGHDILELIGSLQGSILDDDTITGSFSTNDIHIDAISTAEGEDFVYRYTSPNNQYAISPSVRVASVNFERDIRFCVVILKDTVAVTLPRDLEVDGIKAITNMTSAVLSIKSKGFNTSALKENITLTLPHSENIVKPDNWSYYCSFYVPARKTFSTQGCILKRSGSSDKWTMCSCNHMTSFAILMSVTNTQLSRANHFALNVISYMGCGVSIACMIFSLSVVRVSRLTTIRIHILINQCVSILLAQLLFITSVENASSNRMACKVVAVVLHVLFLSVAFWMLIQGFYIYIKMQMVPRIKIHICYLMICGWGIPMAIVGITVASNTDMYGMDDICWLNWEVGGTWIFIAPVIFVTVVNYGVMGLTVMSLRSLKMFQKKSDREKVKSTLKAMMVLMPILGLTWITGLLINLSVIFNYFFSLSNAFQGLFLFIMQILINEEIRSALRLRKSRILPFNSPSDTATTEMSHVQRGNRNDRARSTNHTVSTGIGNVTTSRGMLPSTSGGGNGLPDAQ